MPSPLPALDRKDPRVAWFLECVRQVTHLRDPAEHIIRLGSEVYDELLGAGPLSPGVCSVRVATPIGVVVVDRADPDEMPTRSAKYLRLTWAEPDCPGKP